nr:3-dehydroquinate synthase II family protein [Bradyrhizobium elkanii]
MDVRKCAPDLTAEIIGLALRQGVEAVITDSIDDPRLGTARGGLTWVALDENAGPANPSNISADIHVRPREAVASDAAAANFKPGRMDGVFIDIDNKARLDDACAAVRAGLLTVIRFKDPTKIPLEIVLAAGSRRGGKIMAFVSNLAEAQVVMSVLESGPDGVIMAPDSAADVPSLMRLCDHTQCRLDLKEYFVEEIAGAGTGDRVCVDTCSNFYPDEGLLVGSFGGRFLLCSSETHPLPYMPTRPFRVNAGTVCSYVLSQPDRTNYLSELRQGDLVTAVRANGETRPLVVGRTKTETRPLLLIKAATADGDRASIIVQHDWHVRVLGPAGAVYNVTELRRGLVLLGFSAPQSRHVGMPVDEYCLEQ